MLSAVSPIECLNVVNLKVVLHFVRAVYRLPENVFATLVQTAIAALAIQERYALVSACTFLVRNTSFLFLFLFEKMFLLLTTNRDKDNFIKTYIS